MKLSAGATSRKVWGYFFGHFLVLRLEFCVFLSGSWSPEWMCRGFHLLFVCFPQLLSLLLPATRFCCLSSGLGDWKKLEKTAGSLPICTFDIKCMIATATDAKVWRKKKRSTSKEQHGALMSFLCHSALSTPWREARHVVWAQHQRARKASLTFSLLCAVANPWWVWRYLRPNTGCVEARYNDLSLVCIRQQKQDSNWTDFFICSSFIDQMRSREPPKIKSCVSTGFSFILSEALF